MGKYFLIAKREGRHGLDFIIESRVTGEVFLVLFESHEPGFPLLGEIRKMVEHVRDVRQWVKDGIIRFAGEQVVYLKVYI